MLIKANVLIKELSERYGDAIEYTGDTLTTDGTRIDEADWINYINQSVKQVILVRPDANSVIKTVMMLEGTEQKIPDDGHAFVDLIRNMGTDGETPGKAIPGADRETVDQISPSWHAAASGTVVRNYMFDKKFPRIFFVTPPMSSTEDVYVDLVYSQIPENLDESKDYLPLTESYFNAIKDWALYLAYSLDSDSISNFNLGVHHQQSFYQELGVDFDSSMLISPESTEGT